MTGTFASDDRLWPVGLMIAEGAQSLELHHAMLACWDDWFAREVPFIAIRLFRDQLSLEMADGVAKATKSWMRDGASESIRDRVAAMLMVVPPQCCESMQHLSVEKVFGIAGGVFADVSGAADWLHSHRHELHLRCTASDFETSLDHLRQVSLPNCQTGDTAA